MKRAELFKRLPSALSERGMPEGLYHVKVMELAKNGASPYPVLTALVCMGGQKQTQLDEPLCFSFDFDADSDVKRLTAIVTMGTAPMRR